MTEWLWSIGRMILTKENWSFWRKTCSNATLLTTDPTWSHWGSNLGFHFNRPATNCLNYCAAWNWCIQWLEHLRKWWLVIKYKIN